MEEVTLVRNGLTRKLYNFATHKESNHITSNVNKCKRRKVTVKSVYFIWGLFRVIVINSCKVSFTLFVTFFVEWNGLHCFRDWMVTGEDELILVVSLAYTPSQSLTHLINGHWTVSYQVSHLQRMESSVNRGEGPPTR